MSLLDEDYGYCDDRRTGCLADLGMILVFVGLVLVLFVAVVVVMT